MVNREAGGPKVAESDGADAADPSVSATAPAELTPPISEEWPPPFLLHFLGYGPENAPSNIQAGKDAVYWMRLVNVYFMRAGLTPEQSVQDLYTCLNCLPSAFEIDNQYVYSLRETQIIRVDRFTGTETVFQTPLSHGGGGALDVSDDYVYSAVFGCGVIARYRKSDFSAEVIVVDFEIPLGTGRTFLRQRPEGGLVCGGPEAILVFDEWGTEPRMVTTSVRRMRSLLPTTDEVFWVERSTSDLPQVGRIRVDGSGEQKFSTQADRGDLYGSVLLPGTKKVLIPQFRSIEVFNGETNSFEGEVPLGGRPHGLAIGPDGVYATVSGEHDRGPEYTLSEEITNWIAKIPFSEFE